MIKYNFRPMRADASKVGLTALLCVLLTASCTPLAIAQAPGTPLPPLASATLQPTSTHLPTYTPSPAPSHTASPTITRTLPPSVTPSPSGPLWAGIEGTECLPLDGLIQYAQVVEVTDGDSIVIAFGEVQYRLRYTGVDSPELSMPGGEPAQALNASMIAGKAIILVREISETDVYERLLRYVLADGVFVNYQMVRQGQALPRDYPPDSACAQVFLEAHQQALAEGLIQPTPTPRPLPAGNCHPAYPDVCIPPSPPDLDCKDIPYRRFRVLPPDPHFFDGNGDGIGCTGP